VRRLLADTDAPFDTRRFLMSDNRLPFYLADISKASGKFDALNAWVPTPLEECLAVGDLTVAREVTCFLLELLKDVWWSEVEYSDVADPCTPRAMNWPAFFGWLRFLVVWEQVAASPIRSCLLQVRPILCAARPGNARIGRVERGSMTEVLLDLADDLEDREAVVSAPDEVLDLARRFAARTPPAEKSNPLAWVRRYNTVMGFNSEQVEALRERMDGVRVNEQALLVREALDGLDEAATAAEVDREYYRATALRLQLNLPVAGKTRQPTPETADVPLKDVFLDVLRFLPPGERLQWKQIAGKVGRQKGSHIREVLAEMRGLDLLDNIPGRGYGRGPKAPPWTAPAVGSVSARVG
jgi:hypothetical protein